ncbi:MAG: PepSY domain-containing protein [Xanthobacteraceae bacterium]
MGALARVLIVALFAGVVALTPARAQDGLRPIYSGIEHPRGCLNPRERRALIESGAVLRLVTVVRSVHTTVPGILVRARLCRRPEGLTYLLTLLAFDGKVTQVAVDAVKGTLIGER